MVCFLIGGANASLRFFLSLQVQYLHAALDPDSMLLCGGGFFTLDQPLLVSVSSQKLFLEINVKTMTTPMDRTRFDS